MSATVTTPDIEQAPEEGTDGFWARLGIPLRPYAAWLSLAGAVLLIASAFLSWSWTPVVGDLSIDFYPATVQVFAIVLAVAAILLVLMSVGSLRRTGEWVEVGPALRALAAGSVLFVVITLAVVAVSSGGLVNINPGGWLALVATLVLSAGAATLQHTTTRRPWRVEVPGWVGILLITVMLAMVLFGAAFALDIEDGAVFSLFCVLAFVLGWTVARSGFFALVGIIAQEHRRVLMLGAFAVAFLFPFTQDGSDANMSIATQVLIFAATALGLNIVVGLAGLLDLGYIAFLGAGAYVGAILSNSAFATIGWTPPFFVVVILGAVVASILGLIIGSPTLRVSGDYLAIVTLAFGEIFRLAMGNLDGTDGPDLTNGPNGIPAIPDLKFGSFDFGATHEVFGITLGRFANYYFLLLVVAAFIILVFSRLNDSRIGRGWVAIREDEKAAEAMGVNTFGLKLFAFAGGAFLAGMAGTIKAHQDVSVTPDQYVFLESAFLLAAIVLGGMGTVAGVLIGATILKLLPEKLRFVADYRLLLFGLLLVLMMRFRPEGIIANRRRQLEFHEEDEELADLVEDVHIEGEEART